MRSPQHSRATSPSDRPSGVSRPSRPAGISDMSVPVGLGALVSYGWSGCRSDHARNQATPRQGWRHHGIRAKHPHSGPYRGQLGPVRAEQDHIRAAWAGSAAAVASSGRPTIQRYGSICSRMPVRPAAAAYSASRAPACGRSLLTMEPWPARSRSTTARADDRRAAARSVPASAGLVVNVRAALHRGDLAGQLSQHTRHGALPRLQIRGGVQQHPDHVLPPGRHSDRQTGRAARIRPTNRPLPPETSRSRLLGEPSACQ